MGLVTLPNALTDGTPARGSEVRANDDAIVAQVNGNLQAVNLAPGAGILGSQLSNIAGNRIPTDRIEDDAVDSTKLRDDAAVDANRSVTTNHIRDAAVTTVKIDALAVTAQKIAADAVISPKLKTSLFFNWAPGGTLLGGNFIFQSTGILATAGYAIGVETQFAGVPNGNTAGLIVNLFLNTSNNTYYISVGFQGGSANLTGVTFRAKFISAT